VASQFTFAVKKIFSQSALKRSYLVFTRKPAAFARLPPHSTNRFRSRCSTTPTASGSAFGFGSAF
jgi:hypothetical protein